MKKIISSIVIFLIVLLTGVAISKSDSIKYNNTMNRLGMSEEAVVLHTHSKKNLVTAVQELNAKKKVAGYQLIFFEKSNSDIGYIYSHGKTNKLPITSGRYFSKDDFISQIPFAVQGKTSNIEAYKPQSQSYIKVDNRYISVIGNVGFDGADILNSQTLVSLSPNQPKSRYHLNQVTTVLDGHAVTNKESLSKIKHVLHASSMHKYVPQTDDFTNVETTNNGEMYLVGIVLLFFLIMAVDFYILIPLKYDLSRSHLTGDLKNNYRNGLMLRYLIYTLVPFAIGFAAVNWRIVIISHSTFNLFMTISVVMTILIGLSQIFFVKRSE
ncbi:hypothetical protein LCR01_06480 [Companilactobacillus crustorum]|uniref:MacB-like periplasmic core domain-containing protein n=3 Tax=Companilactobacillus TaxID=2767879 RepID=A0A837RJ57_9LACO|nr:hypothetical protein [Companilactobacillus crustorum]APU71365.1 hypothetical protein BI355_1046 [Companilactobacillus crustorum]KRK43776.1 hypothetical protein FD26_GL001655 [Companilactobacillus crustorum JCM 15951]KRO21168.1 hypothetical protein IV63_GL001894 [Companilactobacillus crustorum]GEO76205.1 hypothetical protein LCR01_06480 [Companilactobacillus crustorum]